MNRKGKNNYSNEWFMNKFNYSYLFILLFFFDVAVFAKQPILPHLGIVDINGKIVYENKCMRICSVNNSDLERYEYLIPVSIYDEGLGFRYCGYINYYGEVILQTKTIYEGSEYFCINASPFVKGYSVVQFLNNNKTYYGIIDTNGKFVMGPTYEYLTIYNHDSDYMILSYQYLDNHNNLVTKYDTSGKIIGYINPNNYLLHHPFSESYAKVSSENVEINTRKYGFIDISGNIVIPLLFDIVFNFSDGYAVVCNKKDDKFYYGYISTKGDIVVPLEYDNAESVIDGIAKVKKGNREFIITMNNRIIYEYQQYEDLNRFYVYNNQILVNEIDNKDKKRYVGLLSTDGKWIIKPNKYTCMTFFSERHAIVCIETKMYIINEKEQIIKDISHIKGLPNIMGFYNGRCLFNIF